MTMFEEEKIDRQMAPFHGMQTPFKSIPLARCDSLGENVFLHESQEPMKFTDPRGCEVELGKGCCFFTEGKDFSLSIGIETEYKGG